MKELRRFPIDWDDITRQTGCTKGTLCHNGAFGWHLRNGDGATVFSCITPPATGPGQQLRIERGEWVIYEIEA